MAEIGFYHLTRTGPEQALPQLLGRTLAAGQRAVVLCGDQARVKQLDKLLWECAEPVWLPHGWSETGDADLQPIWLAAAEGEPEEPPNGARYLFLLDGVSRAELRSFDRVFDLFDGKDPALVEAARERWRKAKAAGHSLTYWRQGSRGWEKG